MFHSLEFELDLISYCLKRPIYLKQHKDRLIGLKFNDKYIGIVYKLIFKCLDSYKTIPTISELQKIAVDSMRDKGKYTDLEIESVAEIITSIYMRPVTDITGLTISNYLVEDEATKLASKLTDNKAEELLENLPDLIQKMQKLKYFITDDEELGMDFFSPTGIAEAKRLFEEYNTVSCMSTGYDLLDKQLQGGMRKGELAVIIASTGIGKTSLLLNLAVNFVKSGQRVVYVAMDNIEGELICRSVGCLLNQDITQGVDGATSLDIIEDTHSQYQGNFWYKHFSPRELNRSKLERYLDRLETHLYEKDKEAGVLPEEQWGKIDVLILDYLELMLAESDAGEFWISAEHLSQEIKAVLKSRNILGVTATQGGTQAMSSDTVRLQHAAGAKARFNAPDLVFSISQDDSEKASKPSRFRLVCLKARRPLNNYQIQFNFFKEKQIIREIEGAAILGFVEKSGASSVVVEKELGHNDYINSTLFAIANNLSLATVTNKSSSNGQESATGTAPEYQ